MKVFIHRMLRLVIALIYVSTLSLSFDPWADAAPKKVRATQDLKRVVQEAENKLDALDYEGSGALLQRAAKNPYYLGANRQTRAEMYKLLGRSRGELGDERGMKKAFRRAVVLNPKIHFSKGQTSPKIVEALEQTKKIRGKKKSSTSNSAVLAAAPSDFREVDLNQVKLPEQTPRSMQEEVLPTQLSTPEEINTAETEEKPLPNFNPPEYSASENQSGLPLSAQADDTLSLNELPSDPISAKGESSSNQLTLNRESSEPMLSNWQVGAIVGGILLIAGGVALGIALSSSGDCDAASGYACTQVQVR